MTSASLVLSEFFAPLQGLFRSVMPKLPAQVTARRELISPVHGAAPRMGQAHRGKILGEDVKLSFGSTQRPLRVVRVLEAGQRPAEVGRMVISGRMADVCAELDRLVAHEARYH